MICSSIVVILKRKDQVQKILIITGSMTRGGAERVISILCNYFVNIGWDICLVSCLHEEIGYRLDSKVRTIDISNPINNRLADVPRMIIALRSIIKHEKPDAVLSFMYKINILTAIASMGLPVHVFLSERNDPTLSRSWLLQKAAEWAYGRATTVIMQTKKAKSRFCAKVQKKSVVIPNPVFVQQYASVEKTKMVVTAGRLDKQKNQKMLIDAFSEFYQTHKDYKLQIFGVGSLERKLKAQVDSMGLQDAVVFRGNVEDIHHQISTASLFVLSSDYEGFSNALLEAAMMGLPCISTDCMGSDEIIDDGESGIIVKCGDAQALAMAMCRLIDNRELAEAYAMEAHKRTISRFSAKQICEQWKRVIVA